MEKHDVPGLSLAICREGKLLYARGYGLADRESGALVTVESRFRICSVTKPITSTAIFKLVESGRLSLDAKVLGAGGILSNIHGDSVLGDGMGEITVRHLLQHTSGGWPNNGEDPVFAESALGREEIIRWTLANQSLQRRPGKVHAYSNFGYLLLGRVIEKVSRQPYEEYVREHVLKPAGVTEMRIGSEQPSKRHEREVAYYGAPDPVEGVDRLKRLDACGGWVATPTELLRFLVSVDGYLNKRDQLKPTSIREMTQTSQAAGGANYACGWNVNELGNWWHMGYLPGSATTLVRTSSGWGWAVLCNGSSTAPDFMQDLDQLVGRTIEDSETIWPQVDLF